MTKIGIEFEYFVSKDGIIVPAYLATSNLDGDPFLGEIKTEPFDNIIDCLFELEKLIYLEKISLESRGYKMEIISAHQFSNENLINFRKDKGAVNKKELEVLEEFSIYPNGKLSKLLKRGQVKASLQISFSKHKSYSYPEFTKVTVDEKYRYDVVTKSKDYSCLFNYVSIINRLDLQFSKDILDTQRTKGVYAIKEGIFGDRIEYRSLPNTVNLKSIINAINHG